jgi:hypothetical protein
VCKLQKGRYCVNVRNISQLQSSGSGTLCTYIIVGLENPIKVKRWSVRIGSKISLLNMPERGVELVPQAQIGTIRMNGECVETLIRHIGGNDQFVAFGAPCLPNGRHSCCMIARMRHDKAQNSWLSIVIIRRGFGNLQMIIQGIAGSLTILLSACRLVFLVIGGDVLLIHGRIGRCKSVPM